MKLNKITKTGLVTLPATLAFAALTSCGGGGGGDAGDDGGTTAAADETGYVEYSPEFPKPLFQGTPVPVKLPNLETTGTPVKTFKAPAGLTNLAAGKTTTSSDVAPIFGDVTLVTDGEKDGSDGNYVELAPGQQDITIDLGASGEIYAVCVWHFHKAACAYKDVIVQISEDADFSNPTTIFNNDDDDSSGMGIGKDPTYIETNHGRIIKADGVKGQFVRLSSKGNTANEMNHYVEVEVWGK